MIHYVYLGYFAREGNFIKFEKVPQTQPSWYRPVVLSRLDPKLVAKLLSEQGASESSLPGDWGISIEREGFIAFDRHTRNIAARKFVEKLAQQTRCDIADYSSLSLLSAKDLWQSGHPGNHEAEEQIGPAFKAQTSGPGRARAPRASRKTAGDATASQADKKAAKRTSKKHRG